jgi:hypothetical protein
MEGALAAGSAALLALACGVPVGAHRRQLRRSRQPRQPRQPRRERRFSSSPRPWPTVSTLNRRRSPECVAARFSVGAFLLAAAAQAALAGALLRPGAFSAAGAARRLSGAVCLVGAGALATQALVPKPAPAHDTATACAIAAAAAFAALAAAAPMRRARRAAVGLTFAALVACGGAFAACTRRWPAGAGPAEYATVALACGLLACA